MFEEPDPSASSNFGEFEERVLEVIILPGIDHQGVMNTGMNGVGDLGRFMDVPVQGCNQQIAATPLLDKSPDADAADMDSAGQHIQRGIIGRSVSYEDKRTFDLFFQSIEVFFNGPVII